MGWVCLCGGWAWGRDGESNQKLSFLKKCENLGLTIVFI